LTYLNIGIDLETNEIVRLHQPSLLEGCYILGNTGTGKTKLMSSMVLQSVENKTGVGVIDPHGDLIDELLIVLHKHLEDIVLLDMTDTAYPFGLNLLATTTREELAIQKTVDRMMDTFQKIYTFTRDNYHIYEYLLNACRTLLLQPGYTLVDIPMLFINKNFRQSFYKTITDYELLNFWTAYDTMKPPDQTEAYQSIRNKVNELVIPIMKHIIGQSESTINFRHLMDQGKIVLVKLDSGELPLISDLLGSIIINMILNAAFSRRDIRQEKRRQFNLFMDECHRYLTTSMEQALTEARKYGLGVILAHQFRTQLPESLQDATRNAANKIIFRVSGEDAKNIVSDFDIPVPEVEVIPYVVPRNILAYLNKHGSPDVHSFLEYVRRAQPREARYEGDDEELSRGSSNSILSTLETYLYNCIHAKQFLEPCSVIMQFSEIIPYIEYARWVYYGKREEIKDQWEKIKDYENNIKRLEELKKNVIAVLLYYKRPRELLEPIQRSIDIDGTGWKKYLWWKVIDPEAKTFSCNGQHSAGYSWHEYTKEDASQYLKVEIKRGEEGIDWMIGFFQGHIKGCHKNIAEYEQYGEKFEADRWYAKQVPLYNNFVRSLEKCIKALIESPPKVSTAEYEQKPIALRSMADQEKYLIGQIANFDKGVAIAKLTDGVSVTTYRIRTNRLPEPYRKYLEPNKQKVLDRMISEGIVRPQDDVAEEIKARQTAFMPSTPPTRTHPV